MRPRVRYIGDLCAVAAPGKEATLFVDQTLDAIAAGQRADQQLGLDGNERARLSPRSVA